MRYIEEFKEDERVVGHYLCKQKNSLKSRAGKTYLSLKLQDKTGIIDAKVWELSNDIQSFEENDYIKIDGIIVTFQNDLQMKVSKIRKSQEGEYDPADYVPRTDKDVEQLYTEFLDYIKSVTDKNIKKLLESIFLEDPLISASFKTHSAAKQMHHSYMGGLLEHSVAVARICEFLSGSYEFVNRDLLIAGALLHDVGKVMELSAFPVNDYTDEGELLGHIVMGTELIGKHAAKIEGFPIALEHLLKHMLISHHGVYEFGSPKLPKTVEAFLLHMADDLDAKVKMFEDAVVKDDTSGMWVGYHKMFARNLRKSGY